MTPVATNQLIDQSRRSGAAPRIMRSASMQNQGTFGQTMSRWAGGGALLVVVVLLAVLWRGLGVMTTGDGVGYDSPWLWCLVGWGGLSTGAFVWRVSLWRRYRRHQLRGDEQQLPSISVVIPAFNESRAVADAIASVAAADYPSDRLQIIAIDDGSTDDTWFFMRRAVNAARSNHKSAAIHAMQLPQNLGKREALYAGMQSATGDILITVDSDTSVKKNALREIVIPFLNEPNVACVAGSVRVSNPDESMITRFLRCYFSLSFRYVRAYQDGFRGVFCAPGALSAYRMNVIRPHLDAWRRQTFLGHRSITGEDRALTNVVLREGRLTAYQDSAVAWSAMPTTFVGLAFMFLRWARSNVRETLVLWSFLLGDLGRRRGLTALRFNMLLVAASLLMPYVIIAHAGLVVVATPPAALAYLAAIVGGGLISAAIYYVNERDHGWIWLPVYQVYWLVALSWVFPFALITPHRMGWLTRNHRSKTPQDEENKPTISFASA